MNFHFGFCHHSRRCYAAGQDLRNCTTCQKTACVVYRWEGTGRHLDLKNTTFQKLGSGAHHIVLHTFAELLRQVEERQKKNKRENAVPDILYVQMRLREANLKGFLLSHGGGKKGLELNKANLKQSSSQIFPKLFLISLLSTIAFVLHDKEVTCKLTGCAAYAQIGFSKTEWKIKVLNRDVHTLRSKIKTNLS